MLRHGLVNMSFPQRHQNVTLIGVDVLVTRPCLTLSNPTDGSSPGSSSFYTPWTDIEHTDDKPRIKSPLLLKVYLTVLGTKHQC